MWESVTDCSGGKCLVRTSEECFHFKMTGSMTKGKKPPYTRLRIMFYYRKSAILICKDKGRGNLA